MINLPEHTHTSVHPNRTTTHTPTTKHGTWTIARNDKTTAITGPGTIIRLETATDERINALLELFGAIGGGFKLDNPIEAEVEDELPHCETCACVVEAHIEDEETVVAVDPAAKPEEPPILVRLRKLDDKLVAVLRDQPKIRAEQLQEVLGDGHLIVRMAGDTLEREWATWEPKPRPPADRCACVGECRNCRADKLGAEFASWAEFEPYLIGGIKAHLVDWRIDWHAPKATLADPFDELCADIATVMARYIRDTFDLDSLEYRDWTPPTDEPSSVDEFFTARDHPVRVRRSGAYDPPGAWLSTTRSNYGAHLSVTEVKRVINALARAALIPWLAEYTPGTFVAGLPETSWVRLTLPSDGLEMAACPDRMNEIPHDAHSWGEFEDGIMKIRDEKIWWCLGCQPDTLTPEPKEEPQ